VRLAGAAVADETHRVPGLDPGTGGELVDDRGADRGVGVEGEVLDPLVPGESGGLNAASGTAAVPFVAFGHHQLGEEAEVGQLLALGCGGDLGEPLADGGQPQDAGARIDGGCGCLFGDAAAGGHEVAFPSRSS
jgi:hypothetical protein